MSKSGRLLPVQWQGIPAMLKVSEEAEEKRGGQLLVWWAGQGAARVLAHTDGAILLERAEYKKSLTDLVRQGNDDAASRIICSVVGRLHAQRRRPPPDLVPLARWFQELDPAASQHGGILSVSAMTARRLLASPQDVGVLHGDIHHGNILDFGERGWLAIDPKGLIGERGFEYANLFCNPDHDTASAPGRFARQLQVVSQAAGLDERRLLQWVLAWAGLSAVWHMTDGTSPETALMVAQIAAAQLGM